MRGRVTVAMVVAVLAAIPVLGAGLSSGPLAPSAAVRPTSAEPLHGTPLAPAARAPFAPGLAERPVGPHVVPGPRAAVDPSRSYASEPAPVGVADFGVDGSGNPYRYTTNEWLASANISALTADDGSHGMYSGYITFQLNVVLVLQSGSTNFVYWVQDVASVETHSSSLGFLNNIWNLSTSNANADTMNYTVTGNGTISWYPGLGGWYAYSPSCNPSRGQCVTLSYPTTLEERLVTGVSGGHPWVGFDYNDGVGWIRYDNVSFTGLPGSTDLGYTVNGYLYTPLGIYYDSEWDYTGPGGLQVDRGSQMDLALEFWNGHNYQSVPSAFNHGGNTGEVISNLTMALRTGPGAVPEVHVVAGSGALGLLFSTANVAAGTITPTTASSGTLTVNGLPFAFTGGHAYFVWAPGPVDLTLLTAGVPSAWRNLTFSGGESFAYTLSPPVVVTIEATGLPAITSWSVLWQGHLISMTGPSLATSAENGSYILGATPVPGYTLPSYTIPVTVQGPTTVLLAWTVFTYAVTFSASNLPSGTAWWVVAGSVSNRSTTSSLVLGAPNGTTDFTVGTSFLYVPNPETGQVTVVAATRTVLVDFGLRPSYLAGTVTAARASVTVDGSSVSLNGGTFNTTVPPGIHRVVVEAPGYSTYSTNVTTTPGNTTAITPTLSPLPAASGSGSGGWSTALTGVVVIGAVSVAAGGLLAALLVRQRKR